TDGDGKIDKKELEAMAKSFAERRKNAAASARDPIVYGVAAANGTIAVRTGTRLYVINGK
ncbi:MAG: serine/threonine protein kinase, partial [Pirellulales bacterium]|nr:serine/threonine protein kinase [Pirellulales bacterium]